MAEVLVYIYYGNPEEIEVCSTTELAEKSLSEQLAAGKITPDGVTVIMGRKLDLNFGATLTIPHSV